MCILCLHRITLNPTREIILHDWSVFVSASGLVFHVQNFVICRGSSLRILKNVQSHPRASLVFFYTWLVLFQLGSFG